jgi:O-antigen/teichoic acid export membrane protein
VRFLTAAEYGIYTLVWAQVTLLSPLTDFGTTSYGVVHLPTEKEKTHEALLNFRMIVSFFVFLGTVLLSLVIFKGSIKMYGYILITATVIFTNMFSGSYFILNAIKHKLYRSSRNSIIFNVLLVSAIVMSLFVFHRLLAVFIIIFIFYNLYSLVNFLLIKKELPLFRFRLETKEWIRIIKKLYIFVLISFFAGLYSRLDVFLLKILKGETEVGIYSAGSKFLEALLFIVASYNVTATPIFARISKNADNLRKKITKDIIFLSGIGVAVVIMMVVFSPFFLTYIFKKNYILSIPVLRVVIFSLPFILLNSIWINILYVFNKSYLVIFVFAFQTILNIGLNLLLIPKYSYMASAYVTVLSEVVNCLLLVVITCWVWKKRFAYENRH